MANKKISFNWKPVGSSGISYDSSTHTSDPDYVKLPSLGSYYPNSMSMGNSTKIKVNSKKKLSAKKVFY